MLLYIDLAVQEWKRQGWLHGKAGLRKAIVHGAVKRIRPKFMTVATMFMGLTPLLMSTGAGSDVMKRIAAPMIGGIFTSFLLELIVYPPLYEIWLGHHSARPGFELISEIAGHEPDPTSPKKPEPVTIGRSLNGNIDAWA